MKFGINLIYVLLLMAGRLIWLLALREMGRRSPAVFPICIWYSDSILFLAYAHPHFYFIVLFILFYCVQKQLVDTVIFIQFRMKGHSNLIFILYSYNISICFCKHFYAFLCFFHKRRPDKGHRHFSNAFKFFCCVKAAKLSSISISSYGNRKCSKITVVIIGKVFCQKDQSCTGGKYRHPRFYFFF